MEEKNLVSYFTTEEIEQINQCLVEYSVKHYEEKETEMKIHFREKYDYAKKRLTETGKTDLPIECLEDFLLEKLDKYRRNIEANHELLELNKTVTVAILKKRMPIDLNMEEKVYYLIEFLTRFVSFSEKYFENCILTPPTNNIEFDFKNNTPLEHSIEGVLVQEQGTCEDICNTMVYLGRELDVPIGKVIIRLNGRIYAINTLEIDDDISLIDVTRCIKEHHINDQFCLVDKYSLPDEYQIRTKLKNTITLEKTNIKTEYDMNQIIQEIRNYLPSVEYHEETEKQYKKNYTQN